MFVHSLFRLLQTIVLLGVIQGLVVGVLLWTSRQNKLANRILSALIFLLTLACFDVYGENENWFGVALLQALIYIIPLIIAMPIGPLLYFYVRSSADPNFKIGRRERIQFLPVVVDLVPSLTTIGFILGVLLGWVRNRPDPVGLFIDTYNVYADIPRWIAISAYTWMSIRYLRKWQTSDPLAKWLRQFAGVFATFQVIWLTYLVPYVIPRYSEKMAEEFKWYPLYIPLAIMIYWLGIKGYLVAQRQKSSEKSPLALPPETVNHVKDQLVKAMETDRLYLNAGLTLHALGANLGIPQKTVSTVLNQYMSKSFNEFVNAYRIKAFQDKISEPGSERLTIAGMAEDCGFHSKATFQRVFKEMTGKLPSDFRNMDRKMG